ncbi:ATP-binding protein [Haloarchaeobius iranensis]|uniref:histidine kinase n=1 Tax=Haloarchaeobius iranensis TaxID=996166 RepID=A0A1G9Z4H1_9EURY|nr:ATP-binding protein [Haloarchaeobius iranensis]SDN16194.1 PAS fold-containing protein [Haloarchaeobius iranensis]
MTDGSLESSGLVLETLVENLPEGVLVEDASREILLVNDRLCELLELSRGPRELLGSDCAAAGERISDRFAEPEQFVPRLAELLDAREPVHGEELGLADGRTVERSYIPYDTPTGEANIWVYRDVTERTTREAELERQNERLAEFASVVSHDLRNPLSVAKTSLQLARDDPAGDHLDEIERSLDRMDRLTTQLLTLAREGERSEELEPTPLSTLVEQSWSNVETGGATIENDTSGIVLADWSRLGQLFENLFRNAVEHGSPADESDAIEDLTVSVESAADAIVVEDDGEGLPEPNIEPERLFETGFSTEPDGTGLGLGIVQEIVTAHGWEITLEAPENGLRFEIVGVEFAE